MDTANDPLTETVNGRAHRLIFEGECLPGFDKAAMRLALAEHLQRAPRTLFTGKPVVIKDGLSEVEAALAKKELEALGAQVTVDAVESPPPMAPLTLLDVEVLASPSEQPKTLVRSGMGISIGTAPREAETFPTLQPPPSDELGRGTWPPQLKADPSDAGHSSSQDTSPKSHEEIEVPRPPPVGASSKAPDMGSDIGNPLTTKAPSPPVDEPGPSVTCPNCKERQTMRPLCRACGTYLKNALEAQREELAQQRATGARPSVSDRLAPTHTPGTRILGFAVPEYVAEQFTLANGLRTIFVLLAVLVVLGFVWNQLRPAPVIFSPTPVAQTAAPVSAPDADPATNEPTSEVPPPPSEQDVIARLKQAGPSVAAFRQSYWPKKESKVFVISGDTTWTWRAEMPSVTRALAEALNECENLRLPDAPPCKVVSVNNFWQD